MLLGPYELSFRSGVQRLDEAPVVQHHVVDAVGHDGPRLRSASTCSLKTVKRGNARLKALAADGIKVVVDVPTEPLHVDFLAAALKVKQAGRGPALPLHARRRAGTCAA